MKYMQIIIILVIYAIEPWLWMKSLSVSLHRFKRRNLYGFAALGYYILTIIKQSVSFVSSKSKFTVLLSVILIVYMLVIGIAMFSDSLEKKLMNCSVFCFLICIAESAVIISAIVITKLSFHEIMSFGTVNIVCSFLSKVLLLLMAELFFVQDGRKLIHSLYGSREILPLIILNICADIYVTTSLRGEGVIAIRDSTVLFITVQIMFACNIVYITAVLKKKNKKLTLIECELDKLKQMQIFSEKLMELRHDMKAHAQVISELIENECYVEVKEYISNILGDIQDVQRISVVAEPALAALLSHFIAEAEKLEIRFCRHIMIDRFYISNKDLCTIISNMLNNAREATEKLEQEKRYISLDIFPAEGGYRITCMNPYEITGRHLKTTKRDRDMHGLGLKIIKSIAEKNHGVMEVIPNKKKWFEITCFIPVPELQSKGGVM